MKFVSKIIKPITSFWVEDYTEEEKQFFIDELGFYEHVIKMPESFGGDSKTLNFNGSGFFGSWSQKEMNLIAEAMYKKFPELSEITVHEMNPYD
jgi:hypothetical protein